MSCFGSGNEDSQKSRKIDGKIQKDAKALQAEIRILLLGAGESGKSTVFKQMKIIQDKGGYTNQELLTHLPIIRSNVISQMRVLIEAAEALGIEIEATDLKNRAMSYSILGDVWSQQIGETLQKLWQDKGIQAAYMRRNEFQLNDSTKYFYDKLEVLSKPDYVPSQQDVLHSRVRTTGIEEATFSFGFTFKMIDVGGQRTERRKWIHFFENMSAIIFCASLSEYDQVLREDIHQNRMHESIQLFNEVVNCPYFKTTPIILFLNKVDLFEEKIKTIDLKVAFPEYTEGCNMKPASAYIKKKYLEQYQQPRETYSHLTCAVNTENIIFVFRAVQTTVLNKTLDQNFI